MSSFLAGPVGEMSKSKMSIGRPRVVHALVALVGDEPLETRVGRKRKPGVMDVVTTYLGISTMPAT